jgi:YD repeat-containing protein
VAGGYGHNAAGRLASKAYADGGQTAYQYGPCGNLTAAADATGTTALTTRAPTA